MESFFGNAFIFCKLAISLFKSCLLKTCMQGGLHIYRLNVMKTLQQLTCLTQDAFAYRFLRLVLLMLVTAWHLQALKALLEADTADYRVAAQVQVANAAANGSVTAPTPKELMSPGDSETPVWAQQTEIITSESVIVQVYWLLHQFVI